MDQCDQQLSNNQLIQQLSIASSMTIANNFLPTLLTQLKEKNKDLHVKVNVINSKSIENLILSNQVDIGLIETTSNNLEMIQIPFLTDNLVTIASLSYPQNHLTLQQYSQQNVCTREKGSAVRDIVDNIFLQHQIPFSPLLSISGYNGDY